jgi:hypothetical protein
VGVQRTGISDPLKRWLVPTTLGGWTLTALLLSLVFCAWAYAYSARDALSETHQGMQPGADPGPAFAASEKLELKETEAGARVTLNWVYAEENYVTIGYEVEDLKVGRRVAGHPAELQPSSSSKSARPARRSTSNSTAWGPKASTSPTRAAPTSGW